MRFPFSVYADFSKYKNGFRFIYFLGFGFLHTPPLPIQRHVGGRSHVIFVILCIALSARRYEQNSRKGVSNMDRVGVVAWSYLARPGNAVENERLNWSLVIV